MDHDKERQEISVIGRLLSLEALLVLMGLLSLVSGILAHDALRLLLGLLILVALFIMIALRRRRRRMDMAKEHTKIREENQDA